MDDLRSKVSGFLTKLGNQSKPPSISSPQDESISTLCKESLASLENRAELQNETEEVDLTPNSEVLESIQTEYFLEEGFDPSLHELQKLSDVLDCNALLRDCQRLRKQHKVVSKKVLDLILQKQSSCYEEFERVQGVEKLLLETLDVCRKGRSHLKRGKNQLTTTSLGILSNYHKRQQLLSVLSLIKSIRAWLRTEEKIQRLLSDGSYEAAIKELLDCQAASASFSRFTCVVALSGKLKDTLEMAEELLDKALAKVCSDFDYSTYAELQAAYALLRKTQISMDQLHMHFTSAIQNTALNVVQSYVSPADLAGGRQFHQLCSCVRESDFIPCLQDLCVRLWTILRSFYKVSQWHQRNTFVETTDGVGGGDLEKNIEKEYIRQKLDSMQARIWQDIQTRLSTFLLANNVANFKFDNFLQVLSLVHRLMELGEEFCGSRSEELLKSVRQQSENYFAKYHQGCLEELKIFLENETWIACPVKRHFTCLRLQEFRSLRFSIQRACSMNSTQRSPDSSSHSQDGSSVVGGYFARFAEKGTPFDTASLDVTEEDILANAMDQQSGYYSDESDEDVPDELKEEFVDESRGDTQTESRHGARIKKSAVPSGPLLTNTTLTVLRHCGKYLEMSRLLRTVAMEVIVCLGQLFQYYFYAVHEFFVNEEIVESSLYSVKLKSSLKRISDSLMKLEPHSGDLHIQNTEEKLKVPRPEISEDTSIRLKNAESLHGLEERLVAVESLVFLAEQLELLHPYLEHLVRNEPRKHQLQQIYSQTVNVAADLRLPVYGCVAAQTINLPSILNLMSKVDWAVKDVMSQHSHYVDQLVRDLQIFSMRLEDIAKKVAISPQVNEAIWSAVIITVAHAFVEGFASPKKCSNGGRALMQLDFTQFISKLEHLTTIRPIPGKEMVEAYVKAYYLPEDQLESWLQKHHEFSQKQLQSVVNCVCQSNKKTRLKFSLIVEDLARSNIKG